FKYRDVSTPIGTLRVEADVVIYNRTEDMALLKLRTEDKARYMANLPPEPTKLFVMDESIAVGCSLGFPPLPSVGVITRLNFQIDSLPYHMSCSQIIYGNSGGAIFLAKTGELIGIPSRGVVIGWGTPIPHMGLFIPIIRVYNWLAEQHYDFIYDLSKDEVKCLEVREKELEAKKNKGE
ncbi:MAG: serine protease, partial [Nanoarchaeota archaeon]|nr:serine protease [Nanoarchaeota archaeon]